MLSLSDMRRDARAAFDAAVAEVQPRRLVPRVVQKIGSSLVVAGERWPEVGGRRVVMAIGKAAPGLAEAWIAAAAGWAGEVWVLSPHDAPVSARLEAAATILRGSHPYPDAAGEAATRRLLEVATSLGDDDLLVVLLSGGGSALLAAPVAGIELAEVRATTQALLHAGAAISELNCVRRQLLAAAGGGLARAAWPAPVRTLILSDVLGDPLPDIASGPTVPPSSGAADALAVLDRLALRTEVPAAVRRVLETAAARPTEVPAWAAAVSTRVIGNNLSAVTAAARELQRRGYVVEVARDRLTGEARDRGRELADEVRAWKPPAPAAVVSGGETTVTVRGGGRGGRNQELALAAAMELDGADGIVLLAAGTDGIDGLSDNAGAVIDGGTAARLRAAGVDAAAALAANDSAAALAAAGDTIHTGPTGTNVCDLTMVLQAPVPEPRKERP
jgi:glycerate-2-kinase